ncbi:hypothetical protein B296_00003612 [Ensete ventricosum]|uniref:Uncharacterized protein n=1 Tax=Ensete ventricosum TaxID=4639 RepID=A0A427B795_ENSVE|nr:hypothetical protein B296_00003612 [Ensete ventricosum]
MLIEDDSQGDLDREATTMVEEEDGSDNVGCGSTVILQGHRRCGGGASRDRCWLRSRRIAARDYYWQHFEGIKGDLFWLQFWWSFRAMMAVDEG